MTMHHLWCNIKIPDNLLCIKQKNILPDEHINESLIVFDDVLAHKVSYGDWKMPSWMQTIVFSDWEVE